MDGIIIINKPKGCTSHDVVAKVKRAVKKKVGHTGTLDPMATGVLPLLIGKGTLCSKYLINHDKIYKVLLQLGKKTDTADAEGQIIEEAEVNQETLKKENVKKVLESLVGKQEQIPPMYSAIKVNGKKLYEYARKSQTVEIKPRQIEIYNIQLLNVNEQKKQIEFEVSCSKGTYIRSLCEEVAKRMETVGFMQELQRLKVGEFTIEQAIDVKEVEKGENLPIITIEEIFKIQPFLEITKRELELFLNGVKLTKKENDGIYRIYQNKEFIGIATIQNNLLKRDIIL